jgi:predicted nucleotidyltransferase
MPPSTSTPTTSASSKVCSPADIISRLEAHRATLEKLNVKKLYLFGSIARGEATDQSDADFLLEYDRPFGLFQLVAVGNYLEKILGRPIDLGTEVSLKEGFRESVMRDLVDVF